MIVKRPNCKRTLSFLLALMCMLCASARQANAVERRGVFIVGLETDRGTYALGQPIKLRFTIRNVTGSQIMATTNVPWAMFSLSIVDSKNQMLSTSGTEGYRISPAYQRRYPPGAKVTLQYTDPSTNLTSEWVPVSFWGYNFAAPGKYFITAIPRLLGISQDAGPQQWFTTSSDDHSNTVPITISR